MAFCGWNKKVLCHKYRTISLSTLVESVRVIVVFFQSPLQWLYNSCEIFHWNYLLLLFLMQIPFCYFIFLYYPLYNLYILMAVCCAALNPLKKITSIDIGHQFTFCALCFCKLSLQSSGNRVCKKPEPSCSANWPHPHIFSLCLWVSKKIIPLNKFRGQKI
jgi:hypothetical protein